jgi:UDP-N-acetyl-D-glucosamine dehydrogenase
MVLYGSIIEKVVPVSSTKVAEITKLLENIHRSVNIGLVNEMKIIADKMGIDIHEAINAASTKPFGFIPYFPGPGIGGHCIPIDPFYLTWKAREYGIHTRFIELAGEINNSMPDYVMDKVNFTLNKSKISLNGAKILILGIAYKKNVDDMRESPSVVIMEKLIKSGAQVEYSDPHVPAFPPMRNHHLDLKSVEITREKLQTYDCVVLTTDHDKFDYELIQTYSKRIVDTRGKFKESQENIVRA